ncbi:tyrosine-protein kinase SRK2-like isoform X2 [Pristis pectinata]|uniref:tyrosine-protein kinase SRK2-like isoform X2 n=1 Tax=Pristis pectinata TaxID=685728 RepID=UPI00223DF11E|nr:tyrosine-protein kinase SRK2-like isoform X2 [Pristis pectinata]
MNEAIGAAVCTSESTQLCVPATNTDQQDLQTSSPGTTNTDTKREDKGLQENEILTSYVVLFDYVAQNHEELTVRKGEFVEILSKERDWWLVQKVRKNSESSKHNQSCSGWYCGKMTRFEAENHLSSSDNVGLFLVRRSESLQDSYVLSARTEESVVHFIIFQNGNGRFHIKEDLGFTTIHELVEHYKNNEVHCGIKLKRPSEKRKPAFHHLSYKTVDKWERPKEEFTLVKRIGSGNYGEVWKAIWNNNVPVAIKMLKADNTDSSNFLKEAQIMKSFKHQNLITLYAVCTRTQPFFIVIEMMKHGDLLNYLRKSEGCFTTVQLINMAVQIAAGMSYLESNCYVHLDLAARNVLVGDNIICKISDFGLTKLLKGTSATEIPDGQFPIKWTAPEVTSKNQISMQSDVWSFGIVLYEIFTFGKVPYPGMPNKNVLKELVKGYRMPCPNGCPQPIYNIMKECWNEVPSQRPSFSTLKLQLEDFITTNYGSLY